MAEVYAGAVYGIDADEVEIEVSDGGPGFSLDDTPAGHGLDNLRSRLQTLFGSRASLAVSRREGACVVAIEVPAACKFS